MVTSSFTRGSPRGRWLGRRYGWSLANSSGTSASAWPAIDHRLQGGRLPREVLGGASEPLHVRSELERRFVDLCPEAKLPPPALNVIVQGFEVDAQWSQRRLSVSSMGSLIIAAAPRSSSDRLRDADLQLAGYRVLRITSRRLDREPAAIAASLRTLLSVPPP